MIAASSCLLSEDVLDHAERHADAGAREAQVPVDALCEIPATSGPMNAPRLMPM